MWSFSWGHPRGLSHEDILVVFLMRTSLWPFSWGRPHGHCTRTHTIGKHAPRTCVGEQSILVHPQRRVWVRGQVWPVPTAASTGTSSPSPSTRTSPSPWATSKLTSAEKHLRQSFITIFLDNSLIKALDRRVMNSKRQMVKLLDLASGVIFEAHFGGGVSQLVWPVLQQPVLLLPGLPPPPLLLPARHSPLPLPPSVHHQLVEDWEVVASSSPEEISRGKALTVVAHLGKEWTVTHKLLPHSYSSWDLQGSTCIKYET